MHKNKRWLLVLLWMLLIPVIGIQAQDATPASGGTLTFAFNADWGVLDPAATRAMAHRLETVRDLAEELFVLVTLGDERNVVATYVAGERAELPSFSGAA